MNAARPSASKNSEIHSHPMRKLLLLITAITGMILPAGNSQAGESYREITREDTRYSAPPVVVYREERIYRPRVRVVEVPYCAPVRSYCAPPRPVYYRSYGYCEPRPRVYVGRPRIAFSFGY